MTDIFMNVLTEDINITDNKIVVMKEILPSLRQRLTIRLKTFNDEWVLNKNAGLPYFQQIYKKGISKDVVDSLFRSFILKTPDVERLISFSSILDGRNRTYTLNFSVATSSGETLAITDFEV